MRDRLFKEAGKFVVLLHEFNVTCSIEPNQPKYNSIYLFSCHELDSWLE
jgi:hypothetical protein